MLLVNNATRISHFSHLVEISQWKEYCEIVSENNCTTSDGVAQYYPPTPDDWNRMFMEGGIYTGYFRATEKNDCVANPTTCTGHIADFPCEWGSFVIPQMYHHNIALESDGKQAGGRGYTYSQLIEMWAAANATKSNLAAMWWTPEALHSTYLGTDSQMEKIQLTWPTQECFENRINASQQCEYNTLAEQVGDPRGACDEAPQLLRKIIVKNLYAAIYSSDIPEAKRSPAYDAIKAFRITELQYGDILNDWIQRDIDKYGFDPRYATCKWVLDNLDLVESFVPRSYPRIAQERRNLEDPLYMCALVLGCAALLLTIYSSVMTYHLRDKPVMVYAQVEFLALLLLGLFLVSCGAILLTIAPDTDSSFACQLAAWLEVLGYTIQLVPMLVKVFAIHKLLHAAERMQRVVLTKNQLFGTVLGISTLVVSFLICWTVMDRRRPHSEHTLTEDVTEEGDTVVTVNYFCSSDSDVWRYLRSFWYCVLLVFATILAFQTRHIREEFNESKTLAIMIYSHFLFLAVRLVTYLFRGVLSETYFGGIRAINFSADAIMTMLIYFFPKFSLKNYDEGERNSSILRSRSSRHLTNNNGLSSRPFQGAVAVPEEQRPVQTYNTSSTSNGAESGNESG